jgi:hypothetical protein
VVRTMNYPRDHWQIEGPKKAHPSIIQRVPETTDKYEAPPDFQ